MAINFPGSLDNFTNPTSSSPINSPSHADQHANANDAIEALEAKVGVDGSSVVTSHDYKIAQLQSLVTSAVAGAKSIYQDVRNQSGSAFTKATPVYVSGSTGASGQLLVSAASNATEATSSKTMGITTSAISNNSNGQVISEGIIEGIDTTGAADGDPVWLGVNGAKIYGLANKPSAPAHLVFLGIVIRGGQANTGSMYVKIQNGFELHELHNVEVSSLVNGNILAYDSTTQTWKNTNTLQSTSSTTPLVVKASASQSVDIFQIQNSSGNPIFYVNRYNQLIGNQPIYQYNTLYLGSPTTSAIPLTVRGAASQTANLQEWQDSSGGILSKIVSNGGAYFGSGLFVEGQYGSYGTIFARPYSATTIPIVARGAASQTASLQEWQNSAGNAMAIMSSGGDLTVAGFISAPNYSVTAGTASFSNNSYSASTVVLKVKGATSQTASLQEWQDTSGTVLGSVVQTDSNNMVLRLPQIQGKSGGYPWISFGSSITNTANQATDKPLVVKGASSQSANLTEWQNSAGTVLANIYPEGYLGIGNNYNAPSVSGRSTGTKIILYPVSGQMDYAIGVESLFVWYTAPGTAGHKFYVNNSATPALTINSTGNIITKLNSASSVGLIVQGAASQSADLQQWQNSSGTVLVKVDSAGQIISTGNDHYFSSSTAYRPNIHITNTTADSNGSYILFEKSRAGGAVVSGDVLGVLNFAGSDSSIFGGSAIVYGVAEGTFSSTSRPGRLVFATVSTNTTSMIDRMTIANSGTVTINGFGAGAQGLIIKGAASQTADLQQWQNSAGNSVAVISPGGNLDIALRLTAYNGVSAYNASTFGDPTNFGTYIYSNMVGISTGSAGNVGLVIRGVTSQSGDLQQWRDSSGNILTGISSNGLIYSGKSYSSYNIESAGTLASSESIANTFNLQGKNNLIYPSIITDVGGNGWTSVTSNYGIAPDGTQTSTRYVWNSQGNCFATASDSNPNTYVGEIYTVSAYIKINAGTGSVALRYSRADSSKNAGIQINLSTKTATSVFDASDYNVLSYSLIPVGKNWYRAIATIKVLVNHTIERVMLAATNSVGDIEVWGFQLERGLSASPLTPTTNALVTTVNTLNIPYGQINLQSNASTIGLIIKSANAPTVNLTEWQTSTGAVVASIDPNGSAFFNSNFQINGVVAIGGGPQAYSQLIIQTNSATRNGLVIKAASSQTANIQEWQNNSGTVLANIDSTGRFLSTRPIRTDDVITSGSQTVTLGQISAMSSGAGRIGLVVRGAVSQAVNLQEWQNNAGTILLSITPDGSIKGGNSNTISVNTASTIDTVALSSFTSMEYTLSIKQGSKIRSSKVLVHTDGTSVDSTEYGIMEMGGGITGILVTASVSGTDAILQITITDAATTNATVKLIKTML